MIDLIEEVAAARQLPTPRLAREIRLAAGVSQARLATQLGVQRVTVARWESGVRRPRGQNLLAYVGLLRNLQEVRQ
ncbi:helix-turn-helix transcriptional regulator [Curtobacterium sp. MCBD17_035]|uniref:helix-turn-helix domain-containing protein n=1 Tax=Curtobacterium sp. MCBD17_035 TaxID=2175673 RepID=UPI000DA975B4|nr:helix-turn-helix transcriptional regulator [Curtobacterium sp. MCBD17_035]WIB68069.1 helix-turn-helix transcriptional regulator [Curtobacterium sp. MCBD17_035]